MFSKADSIIIPNYNDYWVCPLINKYLPGAMYKYEGILILNKNKKNIFISHPFTYNQAKKKYKNQKIQILKYDTYKEYKKIFQKYCSSKKIGYYGKYLTVSMLNNLKKILKRKKFIDVTSEIEKSREIKNKTEIKYIKIAIKHTKNIIKIEKNKLKVGISEIEIQQFVENEFEKIGLEKNFCTIAFGKNAVNLHHISNKTKLKKNQGILFDIGCKYNGYCSDISESFWFGEKKGKKYEEYNLNHKKVSEELIKIKNKIKNGVKASKLADTTFSLPHAVGHGLGLEAHDVPNGIGQKSEFKLKSGMVLAIEPGIYTKEFGIRIERNYLVTKNNAIEL